MIKKYEFHYETKHSLSDFLELMKSKGYNISLELCEKGVKLSILNNSQISFLIELYEVVDGIYTYEFKFSKKKDFDTIEQIINSI